MATESDLSPLTRTIHAFTAGTSPGELAVQVLACLGAVAAAWIVVRLMRKRVGVDNCWKFGKGDFQRVAFPLLALLFVWTTKAVLADIQHADMGFAEIVITLLWALVVIRAAGYVLGHVLPDGEFQRIVIRAVMAIAWFGMVLRVTGLMPEVLSILDDYKVTQQVTVLDVLKGVLALLVSLTIALWITRVTESRIMAADSMELTTRVVIGKVLRITAIFASIFIALPLAGIDVTTLSIFTGAIGVGLGFGLQKVASNYVSGFIVLLDRSLRIGDVIVIDGRRGQVIAIESRCTIVRGSDGVEYIIPNEKLVTDIVGHHTYSTSLLSATISLTISYGSDAERACAILLDLASKQKRVLPNPAPTARIRALGERGIELDLSVWMNDPMNGDGDIRGDVLLGALKAFKAEGIGIPVSQREVRLITTPETP
ncbi:MAG TPA: mechanosensitive ion channel domain-containing protein [Usitatibacter sp.]